MGNIRSHPVVVLYIDFSESRCCRYRLNGVLGKIITVTAVAESSDPLVSAACKSPPLRRVIAANYHPVFASSQPAVLWRKDVGASRGYTCNIQMTKICDEMQDLCRTLSCNSLSTFIKWWPPLHSNDILQLFFFEELSWVCQCFIII